MIWGLGEIGVDLLNCCSHDFGGFMDFGVLNGRGVIDML